MKKQVTIEETITKHTIIAELLEQYENPEMAQEERQLVEWLKEIKAKNDERNFLVNEYDVKRIRQDALIACDALQALILSPQLHEDYIKEKLDKVRACVEFISHFEAKNSNES